MTKNKTNHIIKDFERKKKTKKKRRSWFCRDNTTNVITSGAMTTRAQKGRRGERDLWDLIVNNDDICFKHILPRLNGTDLKFLYEVNTETRKLIKRSSRASDLKKSFEVQEMSSISTLEVAWENKSLWPSDWDDETWFCMKVAKTNKLELLKWAREEKKCEWDGGTINVAAYQGNLEMVKYCVANECPIDEMACAMLPKTVISRYSNTYAKKSKRLGIRVLSFGRLKMVISTYSSILLSVSLIIITKVRVKGSRERPLRLFEVLARNRQSALELCGRTNCA